MIEFLAIIVLLARVSAFVGPDQIRYFRRCMTVPRNVQSNLPDASTCQCSMTEHSWSPQDLTRDNPGFRKIPEDDYIKLYQENPELWPVEFFLIAYRQSKSDKTGQSETQVLVRKSANGTSKYGVGTGVPATRWLLSNTQPPRGYEWSNSNAYFEANKFPEFDTNKRQSESWSYRKIDIREDAFHDDHGNRENDLEGFEDPALEKYASTIRDHLRTELSEMMQKNEMRMSSWEAKRIAVVQNILRPAK